MFNNLTKLQYLVLRSNALSGDHVPSSLSSLRSSLVVLDLSDNRDLKGDPFSFGLMGFGSLTTLNVSGCGFDDLSSLDFDPPPALPAAGNLTFLDISNNYFDGSLPDDIGQAFPKLSSLFASNNCLDSYIPASICQLTNLNTILLNKLNDEDERNCQLSSSYIKSPFYIGDYTIPTCLWSLPVLKTAHYISNRFEGPLGDIIVDGSLESIAVTGNLLTGPIPKSMQQSSSLTNIQLSLNRLDGTLEDDAFQRMAPGSTLELFTNRISGDLPSYLYDTGNMGRNPFNQTNILNGNLLNCSKPPDVDEKSGSYSCGSSSIDDYKWFYFAVVVMMVAFSIFVYARKESLSKHELLRYYKSLSFPSSFFSGVIKFKFLLTCSLLSLFSICFNLSMRGGRDSSNFYGTVEHPYGWATTFAYVHSETPFAIVTMILSITLFAFLYNLENRQIKSRNGNDASQLNEKRGAGDDDGNEKGLAALVDDNNAVASSLTSIAVDAVKSSLHLSEVKKYVVFAFMLLLNISVITAANVLYVALVTDSISKILDVSSAYRPYIPVGLSVFKLFWSVIVDSMARLGLRAGISPNMMLIFHCLSTIYNDLLVPIVVIYSTSANCFYYFDGVLGEIPNTSVTYTQDYPYESCGFELKLKSVTIKETIRTALPVFSCQYVFQSEAMTTGIKPSWIYSYSCESTLFTTYIPLLLTVYTISAIVMPLLQLFLLSFPPASRGRSNAVVVALLPFTLNAFPDHNSLLLDVQERYLRTFIYLSKLAVDILMLFTFGIACGYLTFLIIASIVISELMTHLQIGSYLADRSKAAAGQEEIAHIYFEISKCFFVDEMRYGFMKRTWQLLMFVILLFWSLFVFDTIADVFADGAGFISVISFWVFFITLFFSKEHMERVVSYINLLLSTIYNRCFVSSPNNKNEDDLPEERNNSMEGSKRIELGVIQENPIEIKQLSGTM